MKTYPISRSHLLTYFFGAMGIVASTIYFYQMNFIQVFGYTEKTY